MDGLSGGGAAAANNSSDFVGFPDNSLEEVTIRTSLTLVLGAQALQVSLEGFFASSSISPCGNRD